MIFEGADRKYVARTRKISEENALPENVSKFLLKSVNFLDSPDDFSVALPVLNTLMTRWGSHEYGQSGALEVRLTHKAGEHSSYMAFSYDSVLDGNIKSLCKNSYDIFDDSLNKRLQDYRRITNLRLYGCGHDFDLYRDAGITASLYASTVSESPLNSAFYAPKSDVIVSLQRLDTPFGLYGLLHEVGHARQRTTKPEKQQRDMHARNKRGEKNNPLGIKDKKVIIESERDADAYALRTARHFVEPEHLKLVRKLAYTSQQSYHSAVRERISLAHFVDGLKGLVSSK